MEAAPPTPAKFNRRWFQFSLRTLMVAVTLLCVWLGITVNRANRQRRAVETITKAGGEVSYDYQTDEDGLTQRTDAVPPGPDWLRNLIGIDYFATVIMAGISGEHGISDEVLAALEDLPQLRVTGFAGIDIADSTLDHFRGLTHLHTFCVRDCSVTDGAWKPLAHLTHLKMLVLSGSSVNDAALSNITGLTDISDLLLMDSEITDTGLRHLQGLSRLEHLVLSGSSKITDAGLKHLKALSRLKDFDISMTEITDAGLEDLKRVLPKLQVSWYMRPHRDRDGFQSAD